MNNVLESKREEKSVLNRIPEWFESAGEEYRIRLWFQARDYFGIEDQNKVDEIRNGKLKLTVGEAIELQGQIDDFRFSDSYEKYDVMDFDEELKLARSEAKKAIEKTN